MPTCGTGQREVYSSGRTDFPARTQSEDPTGRDREQNHHNPTEIECMNERSGGQGTIVQQRAASWPFSDRDWGSCTTTRAGEDARLPLGHKPCMCEGVAGLRPATPSNKTRTVYHGGGEDALVEKISMIFFLAEVEKRPHWPKSNWPKVQCKLEPHWTVKWSKFQTSAAGLHGRGWHLC